MAIPFTKASNGGRGRVGGGLVGRGGGVGGLGNVDVGVGDKGTVLVASTPHS